jgi:acetyl-CoA decarbonylase/synthase, CODH/ACS complex subunit gamma
MMSGMFRQKKRYCRQGQTKELIIPGYAAAIAGDMEEELPGWTITVGPREAAHIPAFSEKTK